jgi:prevent-host-death family protein
MTSAVHSSLSRPVMVGLRDNPVYIEVELTPSVLRPFTKTTGAVYCRTVGWRKQMREVGAVEAKNKFGHLLDQVEHGEEIVITRRGKAVAKIGPAEPGFDRDKARRGVAGILEMSRGVTLGGLNIKDLINEGRP